MKYLRYIVVLGALMLLPLALAQGQVRVSIGIGVGPGYVAGPPVCVYGYYPYYPYTCAPYGYYGSEWFVNGVFIGAGPWYHGWGRPYWDGGYYRPGFWRRDYDGDRGYWGRREGWHDGWQGRGEGRYGGRWEGRGYERHGFAEHGEGRGFHDNGEHRGWGRHGEGHGHDRD